MERFIRALACLVVGTCIPLALLAGQTTAPCTPLTLTQEQDHQHMMDEMGIKAVRPGFSGNEADPNHANYDPTKANPFPDFPDPLTMKDGKKVTTREMWKQR